METLLTEVAKGGPLWALVAVLIFLVFLLIKLLLAEKDKRIEDASKNLNNLVVPVQDMGKTLERIERKTIIAKEGRYS